MEKFDIPKDIPSHLHSELTTLRQSLCHLLSAGLPPASAEKVWDLWVEEARRENM